MFSNILTLSTLVLAAFATAEPKPYKLGKMSLNNAHGVLDKRQAGYAPSQTYCNAGDTCEVACGPTYIQCASSDGDLHCYDPTIQETCCPDGTGNSCDEGYYCTSDSTGGTWCCPNGLSLTACAAAYSLTGPLFSETQASTAAPSTTPSSSPASVTATPTTTTTIPTSAPTSSTSTSSVPVVTKTAGGAGNGTVTSSAPPIQVTSGASGKSFKVGPLEGLALVAGLMVL